MIFIIRDPDGNHWIECGANNEMLEPCPYEAMADSYRKKTLTKAVRLYEPFQVQTLEGTMEGKAGDWLMIGINGEMYPCDADIFEKTYEPA